MARPRRGWCPRSRPDPDLARAYREQVVRQRHAQLAPVIQRGIASGDLRPDTDVRLLHELMAGPIFYGLLLSGAPPGRNPGPCLVDTILAGFTPRTDQAR